METDNNTFVLTPVELKIVAAVSHGLWGGELAAALSIDMQAVTYHLASIFTKAQVADRLELIIWAFANATDSPAVREFNDILQQ